MLPTLWRRSGPPNLSAILGNLLIGEYPTPEDVEWLRTAHAVTAVLSLQDDADLASKGLRLLEKARQFFPHQMHTQHFHCHVPVEVDVLAKIDLGESPRAEQLQETIITKLLSDEIRHRVPSREKPSTFPLLVSSSNGLLPKAKSAVNESERRIL